MIVLAIFNADPSIPTPDAPANTVSFSFNLSDFLDLSI